MANQTQNNSWASQLSNIDSSLHAQAIQNRIATFVRDREYYGQEWFYSPEVSSLFVAPLLLELGWTHSTMVAEWQNTDLVLLTDDFQSLTKQSHSSRTNFALVHTIIEIKPLHVTDLNAAHDKCKTHGHMFASASRFVTTNGQHWIVEEKNGQKFEFDILSPSDAGVKCLAALSRAATMKPLAKRHAA